MAEKLPDEKRAEVRRRILELFRQGQEIRKNGGDSSNITRQISELQEEYGIAEESGEPMD